MGSLPQIFEIGLYEGLTWFPIVLTCGILYKYLKTIDVSIDGICIISSVAFTSSYNFSGSLIVAFLLTACVSIIGYVIVSFLTKELRINNILAGIILSLVLHSISVIYVGESLPLNYKYLTFLNSPFMVISITLGLAALVELFFRTNLGVRLRVVADNPNTNVPGNPRKKILLIYIISGLILSIGITQYTIKTGLSRSGGGFEFLITALSSFLFTDRIIDLLVNLANRKKEAYSYKKYVAYSIIQSPVFKALLGSILFQIIVLLIIFYTNNPAYWKLAFGVILLVVVASPKLRRYSNKNSFIDNSEGLVLNQLSFQYDNGYEKREIFKNLNFQFEKGISIIWGNNGAGKTSLLKLISGELSPENGSIFKDGKNITNLIRQKRKVFYITQTAYDSLSINTSVFENVTAISHGDPGQLFDLAKPITKKNSHVLTFGFKLGKKNPFWVQTTGSLSGGQAQRLNLFLCSISKANLILADEPTSGLDVENLNLFYDFVTYMKTIGKYLIIVTHDERLKSFPGNHYSLANNKITAIK